MTKRTKRGYVVVMLALCALIALPFIGFEINHALHPIRHQRAYGWDQYVIAEMKFEREPWIKVIAKVNTAVARESKGVIARAIVLDTTPTQITRINCGGEIASDADTLIADYRRHEQELFEQGACGFESTPCDKIIVGGGHSIGCPLGVAARASGLEYEEKPDAIHIRRSPIALECRPYVVTDELKELMEQKRKDNQLHVDAAPMVSALVYATGISSWMLMRPDGSNGWISDSRFTKVFRYLPQSGIILALATSEEHAEAEKKIKTLGTASVTK